MKKKLTIDIKKKIYIFLLRIFNIKPNEIMKILHSFSIKLVLQTAYIVSFTSITAIYVSTKGIEKLPILLIITAIFTILGTVIYSFLIARFRSKVLLLYTSIISAILLFALNFIYSHDQNILLYGYIIIQAIFLSQLVIITGIYIEGLFSPSENQRVLPLIDSSEPIGGVLGGSILIFISIWFNIAYFVYVWIILLFIIFLIMLFVSIFCKNKKKISKKEQKSRVKKIYTGMKLIKKSSFLKILLVVMTLQWMFFSFLSFQFTKAVEIKVEQDLEQGITHSQHASHDEVEVGPVAALSKKENVIEVASEGEHGSEHGDDGQELSFHLGKLHMIFSLIVLIFQLIFASRIIQYFGPIRAMAMHPAANIISSAILTLRFGVNSAIFSKATFETSNALFMDTYHNSIYVVREHMREPAKELLEGAIKPLGIIFGTLIIFLFQNSMGIHEYVYYLNITMFVIMVIVFFLIIFLQNKYTKTAQQNLHLLGEHPEKYYAVEILSQRGHDGADRILSEVLKYKKNTEKMTNKIVKALGEFRNYNAISDIMDILHDGSDSTKITAIKSIQKHKNLKHELQHKAFGRQRIFEELKKLFLNNNNPDLRSEIIKVFAIINHSGVAPFILNAISEEKDENLKAEYIRSCGLFDDVNACFYIEKYLEDKNPMIMSNACIALWNFKKYRIKVLSTLNIKLLLSKDPKYIVAGIYALGEIKEIEENRRLKKFLESEIKQIKLSSLIALAKIGDLDSIDYIMKYVKNENEEEYIELKINFEKFHPDIRSGLEKTFFKNKDNSLE